MGSLATIAWSFDHFVLKAYSTGGPSQKIALYYPGETTFRTAALSTFEAPAPPWTFTGLAIDREATTANAPGYKLAWGGVYMNNASLIGPNDPAAFPAGDGKIYSYATGAWRDASPLRAPSARYLPKIALLGERFFVWGGFADGKWPLVDAACALSDGAVYDPIADTWSSVSAVSAPTQIEKNGVYLPPTMQAISNGREVFVVNPSDGTGGVWSSTTNSWKLIDATALPQVAKFFALNSGALAAIGATDTWVVPQSGGSWKKHTQGRFQDALPTGAQIPDLPTYSVEVWTGESLVRFGPYGTSSFGCDGPRPPNVVGCDPMTMLTTYKFGTLLSVAAMH